MVRVRVKVRVNVTVRVMVLNKTSDISVRPARVRLG